MKNELIVTRVFNAPVESVWKTWTDPELIKRWWGPDRFTCPMAKVDFREGGTSLVAMRAPNEMGGNEWFSIWVYRKIVPMKSIEFDQSMADKLGNKIDPTKVGMPSDFPNVVRVQITFKAIGKTKTEMTVTQYANMGQMAGFAKMGLEQSIDKMVALFNTQNSNQ